MGEQLTIGYWVRTKKELDKKVDLSRVMMQSLGISDMAAKNLIAHGRVSIDGYTIGVHHLKHWTARQLEGRMLDAGGRKVRLLGSRSVPNLEQMKLADR